MTGWKYSKFDKISENSPAKYYHKIILQSTLSWSNKKGKCNGSKYKNLTGKINFRGECNLNYEKTFCLDPENIAW